MVLRILNDSDVHDILVNLPKSDILNFSKALIQCLEDFSVGLERQYQPPVGVVNRPEGQKCLFRPFSSNESFGCKIVATPAPSSNLAGGLHGILAICDQDGLPRGILCAEEVTGYRTALSALLPYLWRRFTDNVVVFGAGKQALWHIRLALALRGDAIKSITVINRTSSRAQHLIDTIRQENQTRWSSAASIEYLDQSSSNYDVEVERRLAVADAIFCTVGSTSPLFSAKCITGEGRERQPYISAVGSWQPDMMELDPELLQHAVRLVANGSVHAHIPEGAVLVDDREGALQYSGEIIQARLAASNLVELGQIGELRKRGENARLTRWLEDDLLVYKSIGVSTTDLAAANLILAMAEEKGLGVIVDKF